MNSSNPLQRWLRNVGTGYADVIVSGLLFVALTPVFVRGLGREGYALWLIAHTVIFYLGFLDIGFGHAQVRFHARWTSGGGRGGLRALIGTTSAGLAIAGGVAAILGLVLAIAVPLDWFDIPPSLRGELRPVLALLSVNLLLSFPAAVLSNLYRGLQRFDIANSRSIVLRSITAAAQLSCLLNGGGLIELAAVELLMTAVRIVTDLAILPKVLPDVLRTPVRIHRRTWRGIRRYALWSAFEDLLVDGSSKLEQLLIVALLPLSLLTPYALAGAAAGVLLLANGPISETFLPMTAQLHAQGKDTQLGRLLVAGSKVAIGIAAPAAIFLWVFGNDALALWSSEGVAGMPPALLKIVTLNFLVSAFLTTSAMMLLAAGRVRLIAMLTLVEILLSTVLILILAPRHGLCGVASGLLIANIIVGFAAQIPIATAAFHVDTLSFLWTCLGRVSLASAPAFALAEALNQQGHADVGDLIGNAIMIGLAYLAALITLGTSSRERAGYLLLWREQRQ